MKIGTMLITPEQDSYVVLVTSRQETVKKIVFLTMMEKYIAVIVIRPPPTTRSNGMVVVNGQSKVSLSREDVMLAIKMFLNHRESWTNNYTVESVNFHKGGKYAASVVVSAKHTKGID